jgi:hypothetical protein
MNVSAYIRVYDVCKYVSIYLCMYVIMYVCMYLCMYECMYVTPSFSTKRIPQIHTFCFYRARDYSEYFFASDTTLFFKSWSVQKHGLKKHTHRCESIPKAHSIKIQSCKWKRCKHLLNHLHSCTGWPCTRNSGKHYLQIGITLCKATRFLVDEDEHKPTLSALSAPKIQNLKNSN